MCESYPAAPPRYRALQTPFGPISFATDRDVVRVIRLGSASEDGGRRTPLERATAQQLKEYFAGRREEFDLPFRLEMTPFQITVLHAVAQIPFAQTLSYGEVAGKAGKPNAARAVGQAVGANPLPLLIPCHRVLAAHGRIGGFGGGTAWKRFLLELEGITWTAASPGSAR